MTAILRATKYKHYTLPDSIGEETNVQIYEDWLQSLKNIRGTNHKGIPSCVSSLCIELLNVINSFEGASVLESCMRWYNKFYERNFELQFAERFLYSQRMAGLTNEFSEVNSGSSKREPQSSAMISATDKDGASISPKMEVKADDKNENIGIIYSVDVFR
ncbi:hypothetical protein C1645_830510 [Glomus cerebriforme]|uniref:Uncharacterized protein n=1 Tax=Glomus cerebriforme TaxID=658196 RepID=A0A397SHV7_9GLOM|nr:hypothetical protein C1645_830510 [Glomus cerebriforme]